MSWSKKKERKAKHVSQTYKKKKKKKNWNITSYTWHPIIDLDEGNLFPNIIKNIIEKDIH